MSRLQSIAREISRAGAVAGGALLLVASITICVDIAMRYAFSWTVGGADELAGYALAIASAWGFSAALLNRSHIRIDTVYVRVRRPSPGRARPDQPRGAGVLLRAGDLACLGRAPAVLRVRLALAVGDSRRRWSSRRRCGSRDLRSSSRSHCCCSRAPLLPALSGNLEAVFEAIGSKSAVAEAKEEIAAVEQAFEAERKQ